MTNTLYLMSGKHALPAKEHHYEYETELQQLIELNPQLVSYAPDTAQMILVQREFAVSDDFGMSLDHLFVDQDGVPVLVEVKRAVDTRIRREVVAQVLDYASCASGWNVDALRQLFQETNCDNETVLEQYDTDEFWAAVATNLKAERLILVFAADKIPGRLQNIIDFLNRNLNGIRVYGVEIRQFQTNDSSLLSSSIVTSLSAPNEQTPLSSRKSWSAESMLAYMEDACGRSVAGVCNALIQYADRLGFLNSFGKNAVRPAFLSKRTDGYWFFQIYFLTPTVPIISLHVNNFTARLKNGLPPDEFRRIFTERLGLDSRFVHLTKEFVNIDLRSFTEPDKLSAFLAALTELMDKGGFTHQSL
ncbi:MAG: hypothetical protein LUH16_01675 [Clostridiales bacterium]|nr:hypothetical protein [Clostridiales bacterium]